MFQSHRVFNATNTTLTCVVLSVDPSSERSTDSKGLAELKLHTTKLT